MDENQNNQMNETPNQMGTMPNQMNGMPNQMSAIPNQMNGMPNQMNAMPNQMNGMPNQMNGAPQYSPIPMPNKKRKNPVGIFLFIILLLLLGCGGAYAYYKLSNPLPTVQKALLNTVNEIKNTDNYLLKSLDFASKFDSPHNITVDYNIKSIDSVSSQELTKLENFEEMQKTEKSENSEETQKTEELSNLDESEKIEFAGKMKYTLTEDAFQYYVLIKNLINEKDDLEATVQLNDKQLVVDVPFLKLCAAFNYNEPLGEYLQSVLEENGIEDSEEIQKSFKQFYDTCFNKENENYIQMADTLTTKSKENFVKNIYNNLLVEKVNSSNVLVSGEEKKCDGYKVTITKDNIKNYAIDFISILKDVYQTCDEKSKKIFEENLDYSVDEMLDLVTTQIQQNEDMPDISFYLYICDNTIYAIEFTVDETQYRIELNGGSYLLQNMKIIVDSNEIVISGTNDGNTEEVELKVSGTTLGKYAYNKTTGDLKISYGILGMMETIDGIKIMNTPTEFTINIDTTLDFIKINANCKVDNNVLALQEFPDVIVINDITEEKYLEIVTNSMEAMSVENEEKSNAENIENILEKNSDANVDTTNIQLPTNN